MGKWYFLPGICDIKDYRENDWFNCIIIDCFKCLAWNGPDGNWKLYTLKVLINYLLFAVGLY
jgi:hypothetical protein